MEVQEKELKPVREPTVEELIDQGRGQTRHGNYTNANEIFEKVRSRDPNNIAALCYEGLANVHLNNFEKTKSLVETAYEIDNTHPLSLASKGMVHAIQGDWSDAIAFSQKGIDAAEKQGKNSVKALAYRANGYTFHRMGQHETAYEILKKAEFYDPNSSFTKLYLGEALIGMHKFSDAIKYLDEYVKINPHYSCAYYYLGIAYDANKEPTNALRAYDGALKIDPKNANILCGMGFALINSHRCYEAINSFDAALKSDRHNQAALFGKSMLGTLERQEREIREEIQGIQLNLLQKSRWVTDQTTTHLGNLLDDFKKGLDLVKRMFLVQFSIGVIFLCISFVIAIFGDYDLFALILGATGGASMILSFVTVSPANIQKNRVDFSQWMMGYFTWFSLFTNTNILMAEKAYRDERPDWDKLQTINTALKKDTLELIGMMEKCCEFKIDLLPVRLKSKKEEVPQVTPSENPTETPDHAGK